ncbi:Zinc-ribbon domain containing protein [Alkalidesulfovibrio alkalitolerans DSM 16529]|uniref:Zinc-ribbon domain containing protein n=1 Tax=Alkalidesulfovibrio alkalitolerans DSM 16529 TaxID=1121439 RepID=S7UUS8_9BACT|nr:zinc ribbon domain-containing protein [Alkalidesulfovibrio alkalitolerans]EPR36113.1 Zinc-ribbon domain containing protein [Alkalidesulfovibrio alkalitolerans DSM 16529]
MIVCTRCGSENPDDARFCAACRHKLQSVRREPSEDDAEGAEFLSDHVEYHDLLGRHGPFRKHLEAWGCLAALALVVAAVAWLDDVRAAWAALPVIGLYAWLRRL